MSIDQSQPIDPNGQYQQSIGYPPQYGQQQYGQPQCGQPPFPVVVS